MGYIIYFKSSPFTLDFFKVRFHRVYSQAVQGYENSLQVSRVWDHA